MRWYSPTEVGTVAPRSTSLAVFGRDVCRAPAFAYRDIGWPMGGADSGWTPSPASCCGLTACMAWLVGPWALVAPAPGCCIIGCCEIGGGLRAGVAAELGGVD